MTAPTLPAGLGKPRAVHRLGGGSICDVWRVVLPDGRDAVVKQAPYDVEAEVDGLEALRRAGAPVPVVIAAAARTLVLEHVSGPPDWTGLGRALADLHAHTAPSFGWHRDNLIGPLVQHNAQDERWPSFYAEQRVRRQLDAPALPAAVRRRIDRACDGALLELLDVGPPASLTHGDLWSGNVVDGRWFIDPAVCAADREHELAFMALFGGFPAALETAYLERWPLDSGWQDRRLALQLYHLLVHVRIFGAGYVDLIVRRLDALAW